MFYKIYQVIEMQTFDIIFYMYLFIQWKMPDLLLTYVCKQTLCCILYKSDLF